MDSGAKPARCNRTSDRIMTEHIKAHYDAHFYTDILEEYYGHSLFGNFGYWDASTANAREASENLMGHLMQLIPDKTGTILDVACGRGGTTQYLLKHYDAGSITAVNFSQKQLDTARQHLPDCNFACMDAANLKFADSSFDNILCVEAAFHFHTRKDFLEHAHRILRTGGRVVLSDVIIKPGGEKAMKTFHEENYVPDVEAYFSMCKDIGFARVEIKDVTETVWYGHYRNIIRFAHDKFLKGEIDHEFLQQSLDKTYRLTSWMNKYLLVCLEKA